MIGLILSAAMVMTDFNGTGAAAPADIDNVEYSAALSAALADPSITSVISELRPGCTGFSFEPATFNLMHDEDFAYLDKRFPKQIVKPGVVAHVTVTGCVIPLQLNLSALRSAVTRKIVFTMQVPGHTQAGSVLQQDAYMAASFSGATLKARHCNKPVTVKDTNIVAGTVSGNLAWTEDWQLNNCGTDFTSEIIFTPSPSDGKVTVSAQLAPSANATLPAH